MGLTYDELSLFGRLRKVDRCGPYSMFTKLLNLWHSVCPNDIADKVYRHYIHIFIFMSRDKILCKKVNFSHVYLVKSWFTGGI